MSEELNQRELNPQELNPQELNQPELNQPDPIRQEMIRRVLKCIATSKRIPLETVTIDSNFEQLGIDSMDAVEILLALENEFDISIPDDEVCSVRSVRDMCAGVEKLVAAKGTGGTAGQ